MTSESRNPTKIRTQERNLVVRRDHIYNKVKLLNVMNFTSAIIPLVWQYTVNTSENLSCEQAVAFPNCLVS